MVEAYVSSDPTVKCQPCQHTEEQGTSTWRMSSRDYWFPWTPRLAAKMTGRVMTTWHHMHIVWVVSCSTICCTVYWHGGVPKASWWVIGRPLDTPYASLNAAWGRDTLSRPTTGGTVFALVCFFPLLITIYSYTAFLSEYAFYEASHYKVSPINMTICAEICSYHSFQARYEPYTALSSLPQVSSAIQYGGNVMGMPESTWRVC